MNKTKIRFTQGNYRNLATKDPLALLNIKESQLSRERDILELEYEMYVLYLKLLELNGYLSQRPLINYLSEGLLPVQLN